MTPNSDAPLESDSYNESCDNFQSVKCPKKQIDSCEVGDVDKLCGETMTLNKQLHNIKNISSKENMLKFHKALKCQIYQCTICHEAWPLKTKPKNPDKYVCCRCSRDKCSQNISANNFMISSQVSRELQFEEMLIARAFPIMHVYTKPRGIQGHITKSIQRAYYRKHTKGIF